MLLVAPKIILRPMFCILSILLLLVFEAVFQVVEACSTTGHTVPVDTCFKMSELVPQVVPASFFIMVSFLVALASTASRCGFHVNRVSRVGVSTCGTGCLFNVRETFSFAVDSVKSVLTVLVVLSCSAQFSVQLHTSLMVFWMRWTAVVVCSSVHHTAKSSACRVFDTCLGTVVVMSFM